MGQRQQFFQRHHCRDLGPQERPNSDLDFRCFIFIMRTYQEACWVAEEGDIKKEPFNSYLYIRMDARGLSSNLKPGAGILISKMGLLRYHLIRHEADSQQ